MNKVQQWLSRNGSCAIGTVLVLWFSGGASAIATDFARQPDVVINSTSLSELPKDIIANPILKDLLTEDFVFYYRESGAERMSFRGALARIAFEQDTDWPTQLLSWMMKGPAEIALWKGDDGKLSHFAMVIDQTGVKKLAALVAKSAAADSQLKADPTVGPNVFTLALSTGKTVYLRAEESRFFVFNDASMRLPDLAGARGTMDRLKAFFGANTDVSVFGPKLGKAKHVITVSAQFLTLGYESFMDGIRAFRFAFGADHVWSSQVLASSALSEGDPGSWSLMPKDAAFCVTAPLNKRAFGSVIQSELLLKNVGSRAIACWYPESKLYTPVIALEGDFVDLLKRPEELKSLFSRTVGVRGAVWKLVPAAAEEANPSEKQPPRLTYLPMLQVVALKSEPGQIGFTRDVGARYGLHKSEAGKQARQLGSSHFFRVKVVATARAIVFSPDDGLVDKALTTLRGRFPSMSSALPPSAKSPWFVAAPQELAKLMKSTVLESLPEAQESVFRSAVSRHLLPSLTRFGKRPLQAATVKGSGDWKDLEWSSDANR